MFVARLNVQQSTTSSSSEHSFSVSPSRCDSKKDRSLFRHVGGGAGGAAGGLATTGGVGATGGVGDGVTAGGGEVGAGFVEAPGGLLHAASTRSHAYDAITRS